MGCHKDHRGMGVGILGTDYIRIKNVFNNVRSVIFMNSTCISISRFFTDGTGFF